MILVNDVDQKSSNPYNMFTVNNKEPSMGFETRVLQEIEPLLEDGGAAEFTNGTLFVSGIDSATAHALRDLVEISFMLDVQISAFKGARDWAFDFLSKPVTI
jgi:hypothetical protein